MGQRGPVPKRESQRRRRSKTEPTEHAVSDGEMYSEPLEGEHSAAASAFWEALRASGQAQFYEPSDWAAARLLMIAIDAFASRPSAVMLASINSAMSNLLVTEGDRRRVKLELDRGDDQKPGDGTNVAEFGEYRDRLRSG